MAQLQSHVTQLQHVEIPTTCSGISVSSYGMSPSHSWIIDSGATNRMISVPSLFHHINICFGRNKIRIVDGS